MSHGFSVAFVGDYSNFKPSDTQLKILYALIEVGIVFGYISENYKIFSQCQGVGSKSSSIYEILQTWEHWSNYSNHHKLQECESDDKKVDIWENIFNSIYYTYMNKNNTHSKVHL